MAKENKKTIVLFALASFLNDLGSDMIFPIWPFFITTFLGANMTVLGFIDGIGEAVVSLAQAGAGFFSDKIKKRKVFIWTGYLFSALSRLGYAFSAIFTHALFFRILDRLGKIRGAPRDAIIADLSTREDRGQNFGLLRMLDNLGAVGGIILCLLLFEILGYRKLFLLAAIPSFISVFLIFFGIKEKRAVEFKIHPGLSLANLNRDLKIFLFSSALFALGSFSYSFLLIYAKEFEFQIKYIPLLYLLFTALAFLFSLPFGWLADKRGRKFVLVLAYFFWGLVCLTFIYRQSYPAIFLAFILYGLHKGALEPAQRALVSELAPAAYRASILGGFQMLLGLCALPASFLAGLLWEKVSLFTPLYFSLGLTALALITLGLVKER